jgi:hypothetical protein
MVAFIATVVLLGTAQPNPAAPLPCCERPQTIAARISSESSHRIGHVVSPAIMTTAVYGGALYFGADARQARIVSAAVSLAAIIAKELYDHSTEARAFSTLDVALGMGGTAIGVLAAEVIEWPEEKTRAGSR